MPIELLELLGYEKWVKIHKSIVQSRKITKRMHALPTVVVPGRGIWVNLIFSPFIYQYFLLSIQ